MANKRKLTIDKTFLSLDNAEQRGFIHRDYIAHCLRWTHVCKRLMKQHVFKTTKMMDVGCGRELPLARTLYSARLIPIEYVGVDVGPIQDESLSMVTRSGKFPARVYENTDLCEEGFLEEERDSYNMITCFEVLEHVEPDHMLNMLEKMHRLLKQDGELVVSTPVWNGVDTANNHVDEVKYDILGACFELCGFEIKEKYGTFASQTDYKALLTGTELVIFNKLQAYYDSNFLSCVFAPLFPGQSRNCLWVLSPATENSVKQFPPLETLTPEKGGSSCRWGTLVREGWLAKFISDRQ